MQKEKEEVRKSYRKLTDYVRDRILDGSLAPGDRLPTERFLCQELKIGRSSVREGLKVLQILGIIESVQGSGNYVSLRFEQTLSEMLSFLYFFKGQNKKQIMEFRWMIEREAVELAAKRMDENQKQELRRTLIGLENAQSADEQKFYDRRLHELIVLGSGNDFLMTSYRSLIRLIDQWIGDMRESIAAASSDTVLAKSHRDLAQAIIEGDIDQARSSLEQHICCVEQCWKDAA